MKNKTTVIAIIYAAIAVAFFVLAMNRYNSTELSIMRMMGRDSFDGTLLILSSYAIIAGTLSAITSLSDNPLAKLNLGGKILFGVLLLILPYVVFLPWVLPFTKAKNLMNKNV